MVHLGLGVFLQYSADTTSRAKMLNTRSLSCHSYVNVLTNVKIWTGGGFEFCKVLKVDVFSTFAGSLTRVTFHMD